MSEKARKLTVFTWEGRDRTGRTSKGEIKSLTQALARAELRKQGINPTKVRKKGMSLGSGKKKIKPMDIAVFTRQLATMTRAGVPVVQGFEIAAEGMNNPSLKELIINVKNEVASGTTIAAALRNHPLYFDDLYCNLVDAGEKSGALELLLDRVATYKEKTEALKGKIKKAMSYPIAVVCVAMIVSGILLVKVVPQFKEVFDGFGAELPAFTLMVINISNIVKEYYLLMIGGFAITGYAIRQYIKRSQHARNALDRFLLKLPIVGTIIEKSSIARFARTLSTTFAAGVPLIEALDSVAGASGNVVYQNATEQVKEGISTGQQLQSAMHNTGVFPSMVIQMVAIGEESGALDEMLDKVANLYEEEVDNTVDSLTSLMEPIIMAVLGVLVGGLIIAMYLPIFQLGSVV